MMDSISTVTSVPAMDLAEEISNRSRKTTPSVPSVAAAPVTVSSSFGAGIQPSLQRRKHTLRAIFRVASFLGLISYYAAYNYVGAGTRGGSAASADFPTSLGTLDSRRNSDSGDTRYLNLNGGDERQQQQRALDSLVADAENMGRVRLDPRQKGRRLLEDDKKPEELARKEDKKKSQSSSFSSVARTLFTFDVLPALDVFNVKEDYLGLRVIDVSTTAALQPTTSRKLETNKDEQVECPVEGEKLDPPGLVGAYIFGVLYLFLALAVVCDEFFVPALEEMSSERHLNLSMDVAGATLMAAGGSAPELFTSFVGTFKESDIGIGTIVGSAAFNVLFVIGMCSILSREVLTLTWWPLFRDSAYYTIGLVVLSIFVGVVSPDIIEWWEATILFVMYVGYVILMYYNRILYTMLTGKQLVLASEEGVHTQEEGEDENGFRSETALVGTTTDGDSNGHHGNGNNVSTENEGGSEANRASASLSGNQGEGVSSPRHSKMPRDNVDFRWPGTFRAGVLKLLRHPDSWIEKGGVGIVAKIAGDVDHVFKQVDINGDGSIDREELRKLFEIVDGEIPPPEELDAVFKKLDLDGNGEISEDEFSKWYICSEDRMLSQVRRVFDTFDTDNSETICREELRTLLETLEPRVTEADLDAALEAMYKSGDTQEITYDEFSEWYVHSVIYSRQQKEVEKKIEEENQGVCDALNPPRGEGLLAWIKYIIVLPLVALLTFTVPDVRRPGYGKWCYVSFFLSICWIAAFSFFMVEWTEIIGQFLGIPDVIMGVTFLAAGTSVPDLLSSVIVARMGEGDMAVSSSIGSNIFDILVGLPIPWIFFSAWPTTPEVVKIDANNSYLLFASLVSLLVIIIAVVHCQGWRMTRNLGYSMFLLYFAFLAFSVSLVVMGNPCLG